MRSSSQSKEILRSIAQVEPRQSSRLSISPPLLSFRLVFVLFSSNYLKEIHLYLN